LTLFIIFLLNIIASQRLYICVSGIDLTLSTIFLLNIVTVMKV